MPSNDRDADGHVDDRPRDKARRSKSERKPRDKDHDKDRDKDRERRPHRSSRSSKTKLTDGSETHSHSSSRRHRKRDDTRERAASTSDLTADHSKIDLTRTELSSNRISLPYPSFSKVHSREAVASRESLHVPRRSNPLTPEPTDVGDDETRRSKSAELPRKTSTSKKTSRPPSPPETDLSADKKPAEDLLKVEEAERPISRTSSLSRPASRSDEPSRVSRRSASSSQATYVRASALKSRENLRPESRASSSSRQSTRRTPSTRSLKKPEPDPKPDADEVESSPSSAQDSSPKTPTQSPQFPPPGLLPEAKPETPSVIGSEDDNSNLHSKTATPASAFAAPPPPPPPPPPVLDIQDVPRVDYLLQNGGLAYPVPKNFLTVLPRQNGTRPSNPPLIGADTLFAPFFNLLDQYSTVLNKQGSVAVATGHRSVARRLLDRLENVFSRDLPPHGCSCIMCEKAHEIHRGLTWGDVLEWVSGRIELPQWPPFDLAEIGTKAAEISAEAPARPASPVKLDPDIAEEFREHYLRQSKKVRSAVDKWLSNTGETPVPPPQEVDDETLTFAILTNLDSEDRPYFNALLNGSRELRPATRAPTPLHRPRNDFLIKTGLSLQRLYRLNQAPRDAESAMYLIRNPHTHDLLVTLSNINKSEWEILISGRFDGFLWSGADDDLTPGAESRGATPASGYFNTRTTSPGPRGPSGFGSRNTTPFSMYSRGTTPASFVSLASSGMPGGRQPVSNDEEMEMVALSEIEREIYKGMENLEDAFEKLHHRAEVVRTALRQRGAGLMQNLQNRRRIDVLPNPGSGNSQNSNYERPAWATSSELDAPSDDDWVYDDEDIKPDDSASNISSARHRRPKRRVERRTPAPIDEEDED
ncbi:hypothetical protein G7046_g2924 [Stylonectria norvegica]|nr:hypothetical protein G7046_g2924 [Stylonectria norvegica]